MAANNVVVLDGDTLEPTVELVSDAGHLMSFAFSSDDRLVAAITDSGSAVVWDRGSGRQLGTLPVNPSASIVVFAGPHHLVTLSREGTTEEWNLSPDSWERHACRIAGRNLTRAEWLQHIGGSYRATCPQWPAGR
jgi:hypothetical protein